MQADAFTAGVEASQRLILRIGMVAVPIVAMVAAYIILRAKYTIDEEAYERMVEEIRDRKS